MRTVSPSRSRDPNAQPGDHIGDSFRLGQASRSDRSAGQQAFFRFDDHVAALAQHCQIFLRGRMLPHIVVHRGRQHHAAGERQVHGGEEIVRQAVRQARQQIGGGRRDHQDFVVLRDRDVLDGARKSVF